MTSETAMTTKWTKEDDTHFLNEREADDPTVDPIAIVAKTWSPTRVSAGWTALIDHHPSGPKKLGEHFPTFRDAKAAVAQYLAAKKSPVQLEREIAEALTKPR